MHNAEASSRPHLIRAIGPLMGTAIIVGTVIGSGVFKKPQAVADELIRGDVSCFGLAALAWIVGGLLALLGALSLSEVAVLFPRSGGSYVYLRESYGRMAGFLFGWVEFWMIRSGTLAALASVFTESLYAVLSQTLGDTLQVRLQGLAGSYLTADQLAFWLRQAFTMLVILSLALVNVRGVRWGGGLQLFITTIKIGSLLAIMVLPILAVWWFVARQPVHLDNLRPVWPSLDQLTPSALSHFGAALVGVLWAYHGWMNITPVAEEVRNPQRNLPIALLAGAGIVTVLYVGVNVSYALVIPQQQMAQMHERSPQDRAEDIQVDPADTSVAIGFSRRLFGPAGVALAAAAVMISVFGGLNGNLLAGPRILFAMGEDGLAPRPLGVVHPRYHTPARAILALALWSILLVLAAALFKQFPIPTLTIADTSLNLNPPANKPLFDILTDLAMFGAVLFETLAVSSIFVLRYRLPHAERTYRCWGYPYVPLIYVAILAAVAFQMFLNHRAEALAGVGFIAVGAVLYGGFLRPGRANRLA